MAPRQGPDGALSAGGRGPCTFTADAAAAGQRLDVFLARAAGLTRARAQRLIAGGNTLLGGRAAKPSQLLRRGQRITLTLPPPEPSGPTPQPLPLDIVYEDDDVLVVNKPPGLVVHPAAGHREGTLVNALLYHRPPLRGVGPGERPGIVHRLDKDTSGLVLVAKAPGGHAALCVQFAAREVDKRYLALVHGVPTQDTGRIDAAVGRHESDRKRMGVRTRKGREAVTFYRVVERIGGCSLLELTPKTGRTHQLRVHLAHLGHPVLGDLVYGGRRERARRQGPGAPAVGRQMLHAWKLAFRHPRTGERVQAEAPLPPDFAAALAALRGRVSQP